MNFYSIFLLITQIILINDTLGIRLEKHDIVGENTDQSDTTNVSNSICELKQKGDECIGEMAKIVSTMELGIILSIKTEYYILSDGVIKLNENDVNNNDKRRYLGRNFDHYEESEFIKGNIIDSKLEIEETSGTESSSNGTSKKGNNTYSVTDQTYIKSDTSNNTISKIINPTENSDENEMKTIEGFNIVENNNSVVTNKTLQLNDTNTTAISIENKSTDNEASSYLNKEMVFNITNNNKPLNNKTTYKNNTNEGFISGGNRGSQKKTDRGNYKSEINTNLEEMVETYSLDRTNITTNYTTVKECLSDSLIIYNITFNNETKYLLIFNEKQLILINTVLHENAPEIGHNSEISKLPLLLEATNNDITEAFGEKVYKKRSNYQRKADNLTGIKTGGSYVESISIFNLPREFPVLIKGQGSIEINFLQTNVSFYAYIRLNVTSEVQNETLRLSTILITSSIGVDSINYVTRIYKEFYD
ncbi:hypothetical protein FG379_001954 [Cryptosporidium bovis]|uniref:uncharacterized protein n=1 Tax=Cryptosporidium bovis TaxID=310047 RepID=UPI00351A9311|nr:hypothetical protein FG379_001954 [Cryptosporidium bovis]